MAEYLKLHPVKFAISWGIVTAICVALTTLSALVGWLPDYTNLVIPWIQAVYGFVGYSVSWLGILLSFVYSFVDMFIACWIFALVYNKLL